VGVGEDDFLDLAKMQFNKKIKETGYNPEITKME